MDCYDRSNVDIAVAEPRYGHDVTWGGRERRWKDGRDAGLPTVPYLTVQYRILTLVPSVPYGMENVPFLRNFAI